MHCTSFTHPLIHRVLINNAEVIKQKIISTVCTTRCTSQSVFRCLYTVQCVLHDAHHRVCLDACTLYSVYYTMHITECV